MKDQVAFGTYIKSLTAGLSIGLQKMCSMGVWSYTTALLNPEFSQRHLLALVIGLQAAPGDCFH